MRKQLEDSSKNEKDSQALKACEMEFASLTQEKSKWATDRKVLEEDVMNHLRRINDLQARLEEAVAHTSEVEAQRD